MLVASKMNVWKQVEAILHCHLVWIPVLIMFNSINWLFLFYSCEALINQFIILQTCTWLIILARLSQKTDIYFIAVLLACQGAIHLIFVGWAKVKEKEKILYLQKNICIPDQKLKKKTLVWKQYLPLAIIANGIIDDILTPIDLPIH